MRGINQKTLTFYILVALLPSSCKKGDSKDSHLDSIHIEPGDQPNYGLYIGTLNKSENSSSKGIMVDGNWHETVLIRDKSVKIRLKKKWSYVLSLMGRAHLGNNIIGFSTASCRKNLESMKIDPEKTIELTACYDPNNLEKKIDRDLLDLERPPELKDSGDFAFNLDNIMFKNKSGTILSPRMEDKSMPYEVDYGVSLPVENETEQETENEKPSDTECSDTPFYGFATMNGGTSGGSEGETYPVSTKKEFIEHISGDDSKIIEFSGTLQGVFHVGSNKTIRGKDKDAKIKGTLILSGSKNVILQNFKVDAYKTAKQDGISIQDGSKNIWVDHLEVYDAPDGNLDIRDQSDFITISFTKFYYEKELGDHRFSNLIGHNDKNTEDAGNLRVTFHHNWWGKNVEERAPRVRFGKVHILNNLYTSSNENGYSIRAAIGSNLLIENNYFKGSHNPHEIDGDKDHEKYPISVKAIGNEYEATTGAEDSTNKAFSPAYNYQPKEAEKVKSLIEKCAGPI